MFDSPAPLASRKRQAPSDHLDGQGQQLPSKRQKVTAPAQDSDSQTKADFWDRLSKVVLSRRGLQEFDRRVHTKQDQIAFVGSRGSDLPRGRQLTRLQRFSRRGGPDLAHLRGFACDSNPMSTPSHQSRKRSVRSGQSKSTKSSRTSPYSGQFDAGLVDAHVYIEGYDYGEDDPPEPANLEEIQQRLILSRASLSPSRFTDDNFKAFKRANAQARSEARMMQRVMNDICGKDDHLQTEADVEFNNIRPFNPGLTNAKPDLYDGARQSSLHREIRSDLGPWVIPSTTSTNPVAPNFFLEAKSEKGRPDVAKKQVCYDNAIGARAMHKLQNYGEEEELFDGNAYSFSATYHNGTGTMQLYATHPSAPTVEGEREAYHMTQIGSYAMTHNAQRFREGAGAYRNARDMAKDCRDRHVTKANDQAGLMPLDTRSNSYVSRLSRRSNRTTPPEADSDTSVDELALSPARSKRSRHEPGAVLSQESQVDDDLLTPPVNTSFGTTNPTIHANRFSSRHEERQRAATRTRPSQPSRQQESLTGSQDRLFELEYILQGERQIEWTDKYGGSSPESDSDVPFIRTQRPARS